MGYESEAQTLGRQDVLLPTGVKYVRARPWLNDQCTEPLAPPPPAADVDPLECCASNDPSAPPEAV
jgi:hypothetical protein